MKKFGIAFAIMLIVWNCTDSFKADINSYGQRHRIRMYSGGVLVGEWYSTGKVESMSQSDGWQFMDSKTHKLVRVGGDVIIEVID